MLTTDMIPALRETLAALFPSVESSIGDRPVEVEHRTIPGPDGTCDLEISILRRSGAPSAAPGVYYTHGGGMLTGNRFLGAEQLASWVDELAVVVTVEYRLAPEHPDPAPVEDCYAGLAWTAANATEIGIDPARLVIAGESAGGGPAAGTALLARDRGGPALAGQMLIYPMLDDRDVTRSCEQFAGVGVWDRDSNVVGFVSASAGMANALSSLSQGIGTRSPMVLLVGQHGTAGDRLGVLQEGYAADAFQSVAEWTKRLTDWELNSHWTQKALLDSVTYPAGPVVLELPLDNQWAQGDAEQRKYVPACGEVPEVPKTQGDPARIATAVELLAGAQRPLIIAGDGVYWSGGGDELVELAEYLNAPTGGRRTARGIISEKHPLAVGAGYRGSLLRQADVVLIIGLRAGELESWFEPPDWPDPSTTRYIQAQDSVEELWWGLDTHVNITGSSKLVLGRLLEGLRRKLDTDEPVARNEWLAELSSARARWGDNRRIQLDTVRDRQPIHTYELAQAIADEADEDATIIYDSYQGSLYLTDAVRAVRPGQILDAGPRVALGQGVGKVPAVLVILNNSSWGGNSLMREDVHPDIGSWDMTPGLRYDHVFEPFGCHVENVERADDLRPALRRAFDSGKVAVLNVVADCESIEASVPWLRLKIGEFYSRGIEDPSANLRQHFELSGIEALRPHKSALDNGTRIPMSFIAELCGHLDNELADLAEKSGYRY